MERDDERRYATARLHILDAMVTAIERRSDFMALVGDSGTADGARQRLQTDWGMTEIQATAVLDLQIRRFGHLERERIAGERDELLRRVAELTD